MALHPCFVPPHGSIPVPTVHAHTVHQTLPDPHAKASKTQALGSFLGSTLATLVVCRPLRRSICGRGLTNLRVKSRASTLSSISTSRNAAEPRLPVSVLCGFLGAGKTTLVKHILETKHSKENDFRCAVIVNDMAELNIDKSLIEQSASIQSEDVIAMQNGCVCCTLQSDLVKQIMDLVGQEFDYMILEASGVSEPSQIAGLFAACEGDHDHDTVHGHEQRLHEVARLDTCVTVVDAAEFFNQLQTVAEGPRNESFPHLLVEQIEYANVIILNKTDLISELQLDEISKHVSILNPGAKILKSQNSRISVDEVVSTGLYKASDFASFHQQLAKAEEDEEMKPCCKAAAARGELPCCASKRTLDSGKSKVVLASNRVSNLTREHGTAQSARHMSRFGITSFIYKARRPFHPERFEMNFVNEFFVVHDIEADEYEPKSEPQDNILQKQKEANAKQSSRKAAMGDVFRSKGFVWLADRHDVMGVFSSAASALTLDYPEPWGVLHPTAWQGTEHDMAACRKNWEQPWGDRRQELVFIGTDLKHEAIQELLDDCLLTDDEFDLGVDGWKATMGDLCLNTIYGD